MSLITTKTALNNLTTQAGNVKQSGLLLTSAIIMTLIAYGEERSDEAREAVRGAFLSTGFVKVDKGTKQPSDKARRYTKAAESAVANYNDKVRAIMVAHGTPEQQTSALAAWCEGFALSNNHYEGGMYLMPLTLAISKKEAKERNAAKAASNQPAEDSDITHVKAKGEKKAVAGKPAPDNSAVLTTAATVEGVLTSIRAIVATKKGAKPSKVTSAAVVRLFSEMDTVCRIIRGETVTSASKEARKLAVEVAKHYASFKAVARKEAVAKDAIAIKAEKKAA